MSDIGDAMALCTELERRRLAQFDAATLHRTRLLVASHARDAEDLRSLLSILGLQ